ALYRLGYFEYAAVDEKGAFRFDDVPPGKYLLSPRINRTEALRGAPPVTVEVKPGQTVTDVKLPLTAGVTVRGQVIDEVTGKGVQDVRISVAREVSRGRFTFETLATTDADGRYSASARPGTLRVSIQGAPQDYLILHPPTTPQDITADAEFPV